MTNDNNDTAAKASIGEVSGCADRVDAQVKAVLGRVLAQRRSAGTVLAYVAGLAGARQDQPATMTFFITIAGRRWPAEETFKLGKDVLGWDQAQARTWDATCRHTALAALAQLRHAAIRNALCGGAATRPAPDGTTTPPASPP